MLSSSFIVVAVLTVFGLAKNVEIPTAVVDSELAKLLDEITEPFVDYGNANHLLDLGLLKVNRMLPDEIYLGDFGTSPKTLKNCTFVGLDKGIHRDGDATLNFQNGEYKLVSQLKVRTLGLYCKWHYTVFFGEFRGTSAQDDIASAFLLIGESGQHPLITDFRVTRMDPIDVQINGAPGFNWLAEDVAENVINSMGVYLENFIEHYIRGLVQDILNTMVIP